MFEMILLAFAGIALVVATFSIHNTFSILVAQRTRESALLRAIGASRRQVVTGVGRRGAGRRRGRLGHRPRRRARPRHRAAGAARPAPGCRSATASWSAPARSSIAARRRHRHDARRQHRAGHQGVAGAAARRPARRRRRPFGDVDAAGDRRRRSSPAFGVGTVAHGHDRRPTARSAAPGSARSPCVVGAVVLGPVVARPSAAVLGAGAAATRGFTGTLARRNAMRNPRRVAGSASALMVGTAVVALFATFGASLKASVDARGRHGVQRRPRRRPGGLQRRRPRAPTWPRPSPSCPRSTAPSASRFGVGQIDGDDRHAGGHRPGAAGPGLRPRRHRGLARRPRPRRDRRQHATTPTTTGSALGDTLHDDVRRRRHGRPDGRRRLPRADVVRRHRDDPTRTGRRTPARPATRSPSSTSPTASTRRPARPRSRP